MGLIKVLVNKMLESGSLVGRIRQIICKHFLLGRNVKFIPVFWFYIDMVATTYYKWKESKQQFHRGRANCKEQQNRSTTPKEKQKKDPALEERAACHA